jgi:hypothetical protein
MVRTWYGIGMALVSGNFAPKERDEVMGKLVFAVIRILSKQLVISY